MPAPARAQARGGVVVVTAEPAYSFLRVMIQTRSKKHTATGSMCYRFGEAGTSLFAGDDGEPREYDFTPRRGLGPTGCQLPEGADESWRDRGVWAHRIEKKDTRKDARQCRDTVVGLLRERRDLAEAMMGRLAQRIADDEGTPTHWVIHDLDSDNPHGHILYAGRRLDGPDAFSQKRDTRQDQKSGHGKKSIVDRHREHWIATCREFGIEISFEPKGEKAQDHIGPKAWARERKAIQSEIAQTIAGALDADEPIDAGDALKAARAAAAGLTVTDALALDRDPVTPEMIDARKPIRDTAPAVSLERPPPMPAPAGVLTPPERPAAAIVALEPPQRGAAPAPEHEHPRTPPALPAVALVQAAAVPARIVTLDPPQRPAALPARHQAPALPAPLPAVALDRAEAPAAAIVALQPPQRRVAAPARQAPPRPPPAQRAVRLKHPRRAAAPLVRLPTPPHIEEARRVEEAQRREEEERKQREKAARDQLRSAITADTAEAVAEQMIEREAGHASAYPSFVQYGIGSRASDVAIAALRPHVKPYHVPKRDRRQNARSHPQYLNAVRRAIDRFREWWRGGRGLFGGGPSRGETTAVTIRESEPVWAAHWQETERQHRDITEKIRQDRERRRQKQRTRQKSRSQLVETTPSRTRKPGPGQGRGFDR